MASKWSQKTYVMVATEVREVVDGLEPVEQVARDALMDLAGRLAVEFQKDSSAFKFKRFMQACGF